ncbi:MAG: prepilin-type N-terminal cleavage/methylation domain-containing protein [Candidatus Accumulibacter sp.]|jgi:prepilin-type N-terminal cleavage/methylation domain-containing protein|nr:prepilin-type N-terminal cleavage/methylation domain-containing protein [Accumulibacter sp.]
MKTILRNAGSRGFTLAELAIVLVIVALLLGGMMLPLSARIDMRDYNETRRQLEEIREALIGFAVVHGRLPRPATSLSDGEENPVECNESDATESNCAGFIPWSTLGVKRNDAWNKMIRYSVTPKYANAAFTLSTRGSKKIYTWSDAGSKNYLVGSTSSCDMSCAPAVILSFGKNNWGTAPDGAAIADDSASNADEDANASATKEFIAREPSSNVSATGGEFDDILVWLPLYVLFNRMVAAGRLP